MTWTSNTKIEKVAIYQQQDTILVSEKFVWKDRKLLNETADFVKSYITRADFAWPIWTIHLGFDKEKNLPGHTMLWKYGISDSANSLKHMESGVTCLT